MTKQEFLSILATVRVYTLIKKEQMISILFWTTLGASILIVIGALQFNILYLGLAIPLILIEIVLLALSVGRKIKQQLVEIILPGVLLMHLLGLVLVPITAIIVGFMMKLSLIGSYSVAAMALIFVSIIFYNNTVVTADRLTKYHQAKRLRYNNRMTKRP